MNKKGVTWFVIIGTMIFMVIIAAIYLSSQKVFGQRTPYQEAKVLCVSNAVDFGVDGLKYDGKELEFTLINRGSTDIDMFFVQAYVGTGGQTFDIEGIDESFSRDYIIEFNSTKKIDKVKIFPTVMVEGLDKAYPCTNNARERTMR